MLLSMLKRARQLSNLNIQALIHLHIMMVYMNLKCSIDNSEYSVIPNHLIKSKIIERLTYCFVEPTCLANCMKSSLDSIPFDAAVKLFKVLQKAEVNLMIIIQFKFMIVSI